MSTQGTPGTAQGRRQLRRTLVIACGAAASLVLAAGSLFVGDLLLAPQPYEYGIAEQQAWAAWAAGFLVWPATLIVSAMLASIALLGTPYSIKIGGVWLAGVLAWIVLAACTGGGNYPNRDLSQALVVLLLAGLNIGFVFYFVRYIVRGA